MTVMEGQTLDQERALYGLRDGRVAHCRFDGPADGESALKECAHITVDDCDFRLRYPLWHVTDAAMTNCSMTETCRAALWYDRDVRIADCRLGGIKALRECDQITLRDCTAQSTEFGWFCRGVSAENLTLESEYPFLHSSDMTFENLRLKGKYSFQYVENATIRNSVLDTKDAFWHSRSVTVEDSVVRGEYLAWYSEGLHLVRCKIIGTQPLCYCKGLILEDCEMADTDLAFELSEVRATVRGSVLSVKNPLHGRIEAEHIDEIIWDEHQRPEADCVIISDGKAYQHP